MTCSRCRRKPPCNGLKSCQRCLDHVKAYMKANRERRNAWKRERYHDLYSTGRPPGRPRKVL